MAQSNIRIERTHPWQRQAAKPWVLLVDDEPMNRRIGEAQLAALGFASVVAAGGFQALASQYAKAWSVVLMDCQMPGFDGYQTVRHWRRREIGSHRTPIIAYTAQPIDQGRERCVAAGMDDYLAKPSRTDALGAMLKRWLTSASHQGSF